MVLIVIRLHGPPGVLLVNMVNKKWQVYKDVICYQKTKIEHVIWDKLMCVDMWMSLSLYIWHFAKILCLPFDFRLLYMFVYLFVKKTLTN